ncbi:MAG TPA: hypothetical protein VF635_01940, partial [Propionibacteriaceae bacterium]
QTRLRVVTIVSAALAAALTAGPALGGKPFTGWAQNITRVGDPNYVWRLLCLLAMLVSITAAICANLNQSSKTESRIIGAEVCRTELACLQTLIEFHQIPLSEGLTLYQQHVARVPFLDQAKRSSAAPSQFQWNQEQAREADGSERPATRTWEHERAGQSGGSSRDSGPG